MNNQGTHQTSSLTSMDPLHIPLDSLGPPGCLPPSPLGPQNISIDPLDHLDHLYYLANHVTLDPMIAQDVCLGPLAALFDPLGSPRQPSGLDVPLDPQIK